MISWTCQWMYFPLAQGKAVVRGCNSPATGSLGQGETGRMIRNGPGRFDSHADATVTRFAEGNTDKTSVMRFELRWSVPD